MSWCAVVRVGGLHLGLAASAVTDAVAMPKVTPVPLAAPEIAGVAAVRGRLHTVVDIGVIGGLPPARTRSLGTLVVVRADEANDPTALLVDELRGYLDLPDSPGGAGLDRSPEAPLHEVPAALRPWLRHARPLPAGLAGLAGQGTLLVLNVPRSWSPARGVLTG